MRRAWGCVFVAVLVSACGGRDAPPSPPARSSSAAGTFRPPDDGRLTAAMVERYLAVQERAARLATGASLPPDRTAALARVEELAAIDLRAAAELGYDAGEYRWVRDAVLKARGPASAPEAASMVKGFATEAAAALERRRDATEDPAEKARLQEEIGRLRSAAAGANAPSGTGDSEDPALAANRKLLEPYRDRLDALVSAKLPKVASGTAPR